VLNQEDLASLRESRPEMFADISFGERKSGYRREHNEHDYAPDAAQNGNQDQNGDQHDVSSEDLTEDEQEVLKSERDTKTTRAC
jgi:hypothetical protein